MRRSREVDKDTFALDKGVFVKLNNSTYKRFVKFGVALTVIGLIISVVLISVIDFTFLFLESLDGGEDKLEYLFVMIIISLFYLLPQSIIYFGCKKIDKYDLSDKEELLSIINKAKQTSKILFILWIGIISLSVLFMLVFGY